tara:strand:- start:247 stop:579 length:333 start_codon:yes stop_codon:yes gene_type:complete
MSLATGARAIMAWAMRGTKQLSPYKSQYVKMIKGKGRKVKGVAEMRPWAKWAAGSEKTGLGWAGIGEKGRAKTLLTYTKGYKHVRKHKKLYGAGAAGAAIWDFLPGKDNP